MFLTINRNNFKAFLIYVLMSKVKYILQRMNMIHRSLIGCYSRNGAILIIYNYII